MDQNQSIVIKQLRVHQLEHWFDAGRGIGKKAFVPVELNLDFSFSARLLDNFARIASCLKGLSSLQAFRK